MTVNDMTSDIFDPLSYLVKNSKKIKIYKTHWAAAPLSSVQSR